MTLNAGQDIDESEKVKVEKPNFEFDLEILEKCRLTSLYKWGVEHLNTQTLPAHKLT